MFQQLRMQTAILALQPPVRRANGCRDKSVLLKFGTESRSVIAQRSSASIFGTRHSPSCLRSARSYDSDHLDPDSAQESSSTTQRMSSTSFFRPTRGSRYESSLTNCIRECRPALVSRRLVGGPTSFVYGRIPCSEDAVSRVLALNILSIYSLGPKRIPRHTRTDMTFQKWISN